MWLGDQALQDTSCVYKPSEVKTKRWNTERNPDRRKEKGGAGIRCDIL